MDNQEMIEYLEWLSSDEACAKQDKLPKWAKTNIKTVIVELKDAIVLEGDE